MSNVISIHDGSITKLALMLFYEHKSIDLLVDNNRKLENDPRSRSGQSLNLKADYAIHPRWIISTSLPIVHQARKTISEKQTSTGIGNLNLLTQFKLYENSVLKIYIVSGVILPTGDTGHKDNSGIFLSPDMQSGSGSIDFIWGASLLKEQFVIPFLSATMELLYRKNGVNDNFASTDNFQGRRFGFGNEWISKIGINYQIINKLGFFTPDIQLKYRQSTANKEQQTLAPNSGGSWLSLPIGFTFKSDASKSLRVYTEFPLYQKLSGLQITTNFTAGLQAKYLL